MDLNDLDRAFDNMLSQIPDAKKKLMRINGNKMYDKVIDNIRRDTDEKTGNLEEGVTQVHGSYGGYVAVKPNWIKAPHTGLLENGHKLVKGNEVVGWVPGKHMYRNALNEIVDELVNEAEKVLGEVADAFNT